MKKLLILMMLITLILVPVSCTPTSEEPEEETSAPVQESWQIGEDWQCSPQAIWGDTFVAVEYVFGDGIEAQYVSSYNLRTGEKERILEFDPAEFRVGPPSIYENRVTWSQANISGRLLSDIDWDELNWDIFLIDLTTGEIEQITTEEHAQTEPRVSGDSIVWLDARHVEDYHNPATFDIYTHDLKTGHEKRLTTSTSVEEHFLSINGNRVVWSDNRHADPEVNIHAGNEPDYNNEIYVYDLTTNQEQRITTYPGNDHHPTVSGSTIVWLRQLGYMQADVFAYDLETGQEIQVSHSGYAAFQPAIHGDRVVWSDARVSKGNTSGDIIMNGQSGAAEIYLYDFGAKQETLLISSETEGEYSGEVFRQVWSNPVIYGDFVVYTQERQIGSIVYAMRLAQK